MTDGWGISWEIALRWTSSDRTYDKSTLVQVTAKYLQAASHYLQVKWNQLSSNNSHHTSCIHKGSHAGKWPDLMTSKPDSVSTLGYHWTADHTGTPLEPKVHWDAPTGWCQHPVVFQWRPSVNLHNWNTLEDHWSHKYTGMPLEPHWLMLAPSGGLVAI